MMNRLHRYGIIAAALLCVSPFSSALATTLAYWRFETPGTNVVDSSGGRHGGIAWNMNDGVNSGTSGYSTCLPGAQVTDGVSTYTNLHSIRFDGTASWIEITNNLSGLDLTNNPSSFTIETFFCLWSYSFPMRFIDIRNNGDPDPPTTFSPFLSGTAPAPRLAGSLISDTSGIWPTGYASGVDPSPIARLAWHHVAFVKNASVLSFYLDYQHISDYSLGEISAPYTGINWCHIGTVSGPENAFDGWMDEMRYSDSALAPTQFLRVVNGLAPAMRGTTSPSTSNIVSFVTESGSLYRVQSTTSLVGTPVWSNQIPALTGNTFYTSVAVSTNPAATSDSRFYRAVRYQ